MVRLSKRIDRGLQSSDFLNSSDETRYREHKNEFDDPEVSMAEKRLYFDDPIGSPALGLNFDISDFKKMGKRKCCPPPL